MRAMVSEDYDGYHLVLDTDQGELEAMVDYWKDKFYIDIPEEMVDEYEGAWNKLRSVEEELRKIVVEQGKEIL